MRLEPPRRSCPTRNPAQGARRTAPDRGFGMIFGRRKMVGVARIELATPAMSTQCSTTELHAHADPFKAALRLVPGASQRRAARGARRVCRCRAQSRPCWSSVWNRRSTSATRSRRWKGLDRTLALRRRLAGLERDRGEAGDEHHPHVGRDRARLLGELDPVHLGHDDVGQQQVERSRSRAAATPRCRDRPRRPDSPSARARAPDRRASSHRLPPAGS